VILAIVILSVIPMAVALLRARRASRP